MTNADPNRDADADESAFGAGTSDAGAGSDPTTFRWPFVVQFHHVDAAGVVFFGRVFEFFHSAVEAWLEELGFGLAERFSRRDWGLPIVHASADYRRPMRLGERLTVVLRVGSTSEKSCELTFQVLDETGTERVIGRLVQACVDLRTFRPQPLPGEFRAALSSAGYVRPTR